jgi:hypothetical protein
MIPLQEKLIYGILLLMIYRLRRLRADKILAKLALEPSLSQIRRLVPVLRTIWALQTIL